MPRMRRISTALALLTRYPRQSRPAFNCPSALPREPRRQLVAVPAPTNCFIRQRDRTESKAVWAGGVIPRSALGGDVLLTHAVIGSDRAACAGPSPNGERRRRCSPQPGAASSPGLWPCCHRGVAVLRVRREERGVRTMDHGRGAQPELQQGHRDQLSDVVAGGAIADHEVALSRDHRGTISASAAAGLVTGDCAVRL